MDGKNLVKKFPKAMDAFCISKFGGDVKKLMTNGKEDRFWGALSLINDRDLYDFFDGYEIFISVSHRHDGLFDAEVKFGAPPHLRIIKEESRKNAEDVAFVHAFEFLEATL